ncbi:hypothetical protein IB69_021020 [Xanthomonas citri]|uniref:TniB family NTP-binding protein n=1 Tax=Xanthomonas citri TaxID=346 RepID=UPI0006E70795|nr:TniB family NTP-binding protein [Xanthomonas citri]MBO9753605.1 TniB family NTP-binding protein [Xanthomonas phaseoli pv. dieffenbachiae]OQP81896.1 hypothetical protein IB69_021020 [Xanthomonas citri]
MTAVAAKLPRALVKSIRIGFDAYGRVLDALEDAFDDVPYACSPICLHVIGPPRVSKSSVVREFEARFPQVRTEQGLSKPVLYVGIPSQGTIKGILHNTLQALGDPNYKKGTRDQQTERLRRLLLEVDCKMIILDELQHLCDKGQKRMLDYASDWLKTLVEDKRFALVLVALPESQSVITTNPQLVDRFRAPLWIRPFDWSDSGERSEFRGVLQAFCDALGPYEFPSLAGSVELAFRCYLACAGKIGLLTLILDEAIRAAYRKREVRLEDLQAAYEKVIYFSGKFPIDDGPFLGRLNPGSSEASTILREVMANPPREHNEKPDQANLGTLGAGHDLSEKTGTLRSKKIRKVLEAAI